MCASAWNVGDWNLKREKEYISSYWRQFQHACHNYRGRKEKSLKRTRNPKWRARKSPENDKLAKKWTWLSKDKTTRGAESKANGWPLDKTSSLNQSKKSVG